MSEPGGVWVVDRIEGDTVVLVEDGSGRTLEVSRSLISVSIGEGTVLRVPATKEGGPDWRLVLADEELRQRRLDEARGILEQLKKRDPGGDVALCRTARCPTPPSAQQSSPSQPISAYRLSAPPYPSAADCNFFLCTRPRSLIRSEKSLRRFILSLSARPEVSCFSRASFTAFSIFDIESAPRRCCRSRFAAT